VETNSFEAKVFLLFYVIDVPGGGINERDDAELCRRSNDNLSLNREKRLGPSKEIIIPRLYEPSQTSIRVVAS
jgi:hypothetical protein